MRERRTSVMLALKSRPSHQELVRRGIVVSMTTDQRKIKELEVEVAALKAELTTQAANHHRELEERLEQAQKSAQEANLEFASQARGIHKMREQHLREKQSLEESIRLRLFDDIRHKRGQFYSDVTRTLRETLEQELVEREKKLENDIIELEQRMKGADAETRRAMEKERREMRAQFEEAKATELAQLQDRLEAKARQLTSQLTREHESKRLALEAENSAKSDKLQQEWAQRWAERESKYTEEEARKNEQRRKEIEDMRLEYKRLLSESSQRMEQEMKERDRRDIALLQEKLNELNEARKTLDRDRQVFEQETAEKYERALQRAQDQDKIARDESAAVRQREVTGLENAIRDERKLYSNARRAMEEAHDREVAALRVLVEEERSRAQEKATQLETELQRKFEILSQGLEDQAREYHKHRLERTLGELEQRTMLEQDKARVRHEALMDAESRLTSRFKRMVKELRENWHREEQARAAAAESRLRSHFDTVLDHVQEQLNLALSLNDAVDRRWMDDVQQRNKHTLDTMNKFRQKCQRLYDTRLKEYVQATEGQLRHYEAELLKRGAEAAEQSTRLHSQLRRVKIACQRWRLDYQRLVEKRYEETVEALEGRYMAEINALQVELEELRERDAAVAEASAKKAELDERNRQAEALQRRKTEEADRQKAEKTAVRTAELRRMQEQLHKIWSTMQIDPADKVEFLTQVLNVAPYSDQLHSLLQSYAAMLTAQLPLLQQVTRREFIKYRLKCIHRFQQDPAKRQEFAEGTEGARKRDMLMTELGVISERLTASLQEYEKQHDTPFTFRGRRYLDEMAADLQRMPELPHAMGSVARSPSEFDAVQRAAMR